MRKFIPAAGCLSLLALAHQATAAQLTSADFTFGFGYARNADDVTSGWNGLENAGTNSPTAQGDFTFAPNPGGPEWSDGGPTFAGRTLVDQSGGSRFSGYVGDSSSNYFAVPITASFTGAAPADAAPVPNYRLLIEITSISIYGAVYPGSSATSLQWDETTPGHAQASPSISPPAASGWTLAASYQQLAWNPDDFELAIASLGDSATRTFSILPLDASDLRYIDGLEISGRVHLFYDVVPEPSGLMAIGAAMLALNGRRRRG